MSFIQKARAAIQTAGGRMTPQRRLIIRLLADSEQLLDADGLCELARQEDAGMSLATVYRTLHTLEAAGLVRQAYHSRDHDRHYYEIVYKEREYLFTCRDCHRVYPFRTNLVAELTRQLETELRVEVLHASICIEGLCPDCQAQKAVGSPPPSA